MFLYLAATIAYKQHYSYTFRSSYPGVSEPKVIRSREPYKLHTNYVTPIPGTNSPSNCFFELGVAPIAGF